MSSEDILKNAPQYMGQKHRRSSCPSVTLMEKQPRQSCIIHTARRTGNTVGYDSGDTCFCLGEKVKDKIYCSNRRAWKLLTTYVPVIKFLRYYKLREYAVSDVMAGLTVGILHIPQALAFGQLTSVKVENGLFTSLWPVLLYVFFGTSAHVSMGTSAVICILTAATVDREGLAWAADRPWILNQTGNGTSLDEVPEYLDFKEELAMGVALISGIMMIAMGFLKLGFITAYLSESFFTAFTSAAAVHIGTSQLPAMLGIKVDRFGGIFKIIYSYQAIFSAIDTVNVAAIICAVVSCAVILFVKDCINERFKHKLPAPIPVELFVVIFGTMASYFGRFSEQFDVVVVGTIPTDIPPPVLPVEGLKYATNYVVDSFILAILIFANTIAMAKICAKKHNYEVDDSQELIAYGMCNAVSSFFKCFPSSVAPPRSMVASGMNARTTLSGIFSSILMLLVILFISKLFTELPKAVLGAIIFIALKGLIIQILDGRKFWRINKFDFVIWFFTFFSTVFLDIDLGLGIGVCVSLITVVFQTQFSRGYKIGCTLKDPALVEHKKYLDSSEVPGVKIFRFQSSLYFANAEIFRNTLYRCTVNPRKLLKGLKKREKRLVDDNKERISQGLPPERRRNSLMMGDLGMVSRDSSSSLSKAVSGTDARFNSAEPGKTEKSFTMTQDRYTKKSENGFNAFDPPRRRESTISINFDEYEEDPEDGDELISDEKLRSMRKIHHIILDCVTINYLDASGANVLSHIYSEFAHVNIKLFLAGCSLDMRRAMEQARVFDKIPRDHLFLDVQDALVVAKPLRTLPLASDALEDFSDEEAIEDSYVTKM
ncbi:prestin-like [Aplysia californica]|uniref:Prestin-like n=1 Tax=Aplysia californica TaxID=6500 RepID=A0ABM1A6J9_APLCA|nr:prestin-like [Aplysia californica]